MTRAATFNIRHARHERGPARLQLLVDACRAIDAEILGLQEVDRGVARSCLRDQAGALARALGMAHAYAPARRPMLFGHEGNALLVRGELTDVERVAFTPAAPRYGRVALLATARLRGDAWSVCVTHLHTHHEHARGQLGEVVGLLTARPAPRLLLADANLDPVDFEPVLEGAGYAVADAGPTTKTDDRRIDIVAVQGRPITAAVTAELAVSDHRPLVADLGSVNTR